MYLDKPAAAIAVGSGTTIGVSAASSAKSAASMLNSSVADIFVGNFTLYGSDVATVLGVSLSALGIAVTVWRVRVTKRAL